MRGAVSVALAYYYFDTGAASSEVTAASDPQEQQATVIVATLVLVLVTVLVLGNLTPSLTQVRWGRAHGCAAQPPCLLPWPGP